MGPFQFLRRLCLCCPVGRRSNCLVTLLTVCCLYTLLQNVKYVSRVCVSPASEYDSIDRNDVSASSAETPSSHTCKNYHVALIIATADEAREASFLLKTLLYHRVSPIHLHMLVNNSTHRIMKTLMDTWELDQVHFDLYKVNSTIHTDFHWHALKFRLSEFIAPTIVKEVVYLGNDVRLLYDIGVLWKQVEEIDKGNRFLGLVTNGNCHHGQEFCYTDKILLFDLNRFHQSNLRSALQEAKTKSEVEGIVGRHFDDSIFSIPCNWAISLNTKPRGFNCTQYSGPVRALVMSGSETLFVNNPILEKAREHIIKVLSSEPSVTVPNNCYASSDLETRAITNEQCAKFEHAAYLKRRTHLYYLGDGGVIGENVSPDPYEVSLLTQLTLDRLGVLERFLGMWEGPATVVFHLTDAEAMELYYKVQDSKVLRSRKSVTYHVVYKRQIYNPINYLRNVALNNSHSPYLLFVDVDLIPNLGIYSSLKTLIKNYMNQGNKTTILIVPAFQMFTDLGDATPRNKSQLLKFMPNKTIVGYGMERSWNLGHKPTNYGRWTSAQKPYQAIFSDAYEPYVVVRREFEARYNQLLLERMGDKIAYIRLLHGQGFQFFVVPEDFIIHVPHPISPGSTRFYKDGDYSRCSSRFFEAYRKELYHRFPQIKF